MNATGKWLFKATDGSNSSMEGILTSQVGRAVASGELPLKDGDVVRVTSYTCNVVNDSHKLLISSLEIAAASDAGATRDQAAAGAAPGTPGGDSVMRESSSSAAQQQPQQQQQHTPAATKAPFRTPGPTPSPSEE